MVRLEAHPIADVYPILEGPQLQELADSIKKHGLMEPIKVIDDRYIIDGRSRYAACRLAKVEPKIEAYRGKRDFPTLVAFVRAANEARRHLTPGQRSIIGFRMTKLAADPKAANLRLGDLSQEEAAEQLGVSERTINAASKVVQGGSAALVRAVEAGTVAVSDAAAIAELPKSRQQAALRKVADGKAATLREAVAPRRKAGKETVPVADRRAAIKAFGRLSRALTKLGRRDACRNSLKQILETIKG